MNQGSCGAGYDFSSSEKGPQYPGVEGRHLTLGRPTESFPGGFVAGTGERERSWLHSMDKALLGEREHMGAVRPWAPPPLTSSGLPALPRLQTGM